MPRALPEEASEGREGEIELAAGPTPGRKACSLCIAWSSAWPKNPGVGESLALARPWIARKLRRVKPFSKLKANGELRIRSRRPGGEKAIAPKKGRAHATNTIFSLRGVDGHSSTARRFRDLLRDALAGIDDPDQGAIALARAAALASLRIERLQSRIIGDEDIDDLRFAKLTAALGARAVCLGGRAESRRWRRP